MPTSQDTNGRSSRSNRSHAKKRGKHSRQGSHQGSRQGSRNTQRHAESKTSSNRRRRDSLEGTTGSLQTSTRRVRSNGAVGYTSAANRRASSANRHPHPAHSTPAHSAGRANQGFPVWGICAIIVLVLLIGAGGFFLVRGFIAGGSGTSVAAGQQVTVVIPEGSLGNTIAEELVEAGVISDTKAFMKEIQSQHADQKLRSGTYHFITGSDPKSVVRQLTEGPNSGEGQLQVPEGYTTSQIADLVEASLGISRDDFLKQAKASNYVNDYPFLRNAANDSLEGFLYPKTYDLAGQDVTADTVIRTMLTQFENESKSFNTDEARQKVYDTYGLNATEYDLLKVASIVEKEVGSHEDGHKVASVIYNRLANNMALQSDATMMYVTGGGVSAADLETDSPYNTYLYKGLTPTPVCSPSREAMEAALDPANTDYLYFLLIDDGDYHNHTFSKTYEEHEAAIEKAKADRSGSSSSDSESVKSVGGASDSGSTKSSDDDGDE